MLTLQNFLFWMALQMKIQMLKALKSKFGGDVIKENGRIYWLKDSVKQLVTLGLLRYYLSKKAPVQEPVKEEAKVEKKPVKKAKKNAKTEPNPDVSQGS